MQLLTFQQKLQNKNLDDFERDEADAYLWSLWTFKYEGEKNDHKQHHIQTKFKYLPWYLINRLQCTVQNILMSLNTLFELDMKSKK